MFSLPTWASLETLKLALPFIRKQWKFFAGVLAGVLICSYCAPPVEPTKTTETTTAESSTAAAAVTKTAKTVVETVIKTETFRPGGEVETRTITETTSRADTRETSESLSATARAVEVRIVEKVVPAPRMAGLGVAWTHLNQSWALSGDVELARFGPYRLDLGFLTPVEDLERTSVRASVRFPLPF